MNRQHVIIRYLRKRKTKKSEHALDKKGCQKKKKTQQEKLQYYTQTDMMVHPWNKNRVLKSENWDSTLRAGK